MSHASARSNSFKGCWTCKARKIRCDERPIGCKNCEKKGVTCGGYDVRLQWMSDPLVTPTSSSQGRRALKLDRDGGKRYLIEDIDGFLANIDHDTESGLASTRGPFAAFPVTIGKKQPRDNPPAGSSTACFSVSDDMPRGARISVTSNNDTNHQRPDSDGDRELLDYAPAGGMQITHELGQQLIDDDVCLGILPAQTAQDSSYNLNSPADSLYSSHKSPNSPSSTFPLEHIATSLFGDSQADLLINHYNTHIADLMQPINHAQNVFRGIYLSTALEGSVVCRSDPKTSKALVYSAIYHSLLASSAFHLWNCSNSETKYQRLGIKHRYQAINFLQAAVEATTLGGDYQIFMTAMLSLLSIGTMSGDTNDFIMHINAATQLRNMRSRWRIVSRATQKLNSISAFLTMLARTTCFQPAGSFGHIETSSDGHIVRSSDCYEFIYGVTPSIAAAIQEICDLAERLTRYSGQAQQSIPDSLLQECEALGDKLLSWKLESEKVMSIPPTDSVAFSIFTHQANAWHRAALIYYYRRIQNFSSEELVGDVRQVAEQMHAAEDAKMQLSVDRVMAPITWPGFIASCEAIGNERELLRKWWERILPYNIGSITRQWDIVEQIWKKYDQMHEHGLDTPSWIDSFKVLGLHILAV